MVSSSASQRSRAWASLVFEASSAIPIPFSAGTPLGGSVVLFGNLLLAEQLCRFRRRKGLDVLQLSRHLARAHFRLTYRHGHRLKLIPGLRQHVSKLTEL